MRLRFISKCVVEKSYSHLLLRCFSSQRLKKRKAVFLLALFSLSRSRRRRDASRLTTHRGTGIGTGYLPFLLVQKRFQGTTQAFKAVWMVPHPFDGGRGRDMVSTDHMQKARVRKLHLVACGDHTVSAVSGSNMSNCAFGGHFFLQVVN